MPQTIPIVKQSTRVLLPRVLLTIYTILKELLKNYMMTTTLLEITFQMMKVLYLTQVYFLLSSTMS